MNEEGSKNNTESLPTDPDFATRLNVAIGTMGAKCKVRFGYNGENYVATLNPKLSETPDKAQIRLIKLALTDGLDQEGKVSFTMSRATYTLSVRKTNPE